MNRAEVHESLLAGKNGTRQDFDGRLDKIFSYVIEKRPINLKVELIGV